MTSGVRNIKTIKDLEKLELKDQLEYINELIKIEGNLLKASNRLGAKKTMIKKIFKKKNYEYNEQTQQFEQGDNCSTVEVQEDIKLSKKDLKKAKKESKKDKKKQKGGERSIDDVETIQIENEVAYDVQEVQNDQEAILGGERSTYTLESLQKVDAQEKMLDLINNYDSIKAMLEAYTSNNKGSIALGGEGSTQEVIEIKYGIQIDLPDSDNIKTSIRTNRIEWELFKEFMKENKEFSNADLISQALREFRMKHQKS